MVPKYWHCQNQLNPTPKSWHTTTKVSKNQLKISLIQLKLAEILAGSELVRFPNPLVKWVGISMYQIADNFSSRLSSAAILQYPRLSGCLLSSYRSQVALTPTPTFHIHPVLLQRGIHILLPILTSSSSQSSFQFLMFFQHNFSFLTAIIFLRAYFPALLLSSDASQLQLL